MTSTGPTRSRRSRDATPLLAVNTNTTSESAPLTYKLGLPKKEIYYLRVNHKRLFSAPCRSYRLDIDNNGVADGGSCTCDSGDSCKVKSVVPAASCLQTGDARCGLHPSAPKAQYFCPDGSTGTQVGGDAASALICADPEEVPLQCEVTCRCVAWGGVVELPGRGGHLRVQLHLERDPAAAQHQSHGRLSGLREPAEPLLPARPQLTRRCCLTSASYGTGTCRPPRRPPSSLATAVIHPDSTQGTASMTRSSSRPRSRQVWVAA